MFDTSVGSEQNESVWLNLSFQMFPVLGQRAVFLHVWYTVVLFWYLCFGVSVLLAEMNKQLKFE